MAHCNWNMLLRPHCVSLHLFLFLNALYSDIPDIDKKKYLVPTDLTGD
jgi:hypothetical protein